MKAQRRCPRCGIISYCGPPDKKDAPSSQKNGAPSHVTKESKTKERVQPISAPLLKQVPPAGLPITADEIRSLALSLYPQALEDPKARKYIQELHLLASVNPDAGVQAAYYTWAWHALMEIRGRMNRLGNN